MSAAIVFVGTGPAISPAGRGNISLVMQAAGHVMLFDCGPVILDGLRHAHIAPDAIDTLFISHRHGDHTLGFPMLVLYRMIAHAENSLRVVAGRSLRPMLADLTHLVYPETDRVFSQLEWVELDEEAAPGGAPRTQALYPGLVLRYSLMCGPEDVPVLGMRVDCAAGGSMTYTGDTAACDAIARLAAGCDLLVHETNFSERLDPGVDARFYAHSTAREVGITARTAGVKALALVHLSSEYAGREQEVAAEAAAEYGGTILVPADGDVMTVGR